MVTLKFAESVYEDGTVNQENLTTAFSTDKYILKGKGEEVWEPRFTYHGFRYVQVEGYPGEPGLDSITGKLVRSAVSGVSQFECSNDLINKIHQNVLWTEEDNLHSVPTDCPQRAERMGWLNDMSVRIEEIVYNFNVASFMTKWEADIKDTQDEAGAIADTAPYVYGSHPADPVSSTYILVPWYMYLFYGDKRILEQYYDGMTKWFEYLRSRSRNGLVKYGFYGDWASPVTVSEKINGIPTPVSSITPLEYVSSVHNYYNAVLLAKIAKILRKSSDADRFTALAGEIRDAINAKYLDASAKTYGTSSQAFNTFALFLELAPPELREGILENLVSDLEAKHGYHLTTGNLCTKYIFEVLSDRGLADIAYNTATQTDYPSWGFMISKGATTIWERWELETGRGMNSHNHPMYGTISTWFMKHLAGIRPDEEYPGFERFIIKPLIPGDLEYVSASLLTLKGEIRSAWRKIGNSLIMDVAVPFNSRARLFIPKLGRVAGDIIIKEGEVAVWADSHAANRPQGIENIYDEGEYTVLELASGNYSFRQRVKFSSNK